MFAKVHVNHFPVINELSNYLKSNTFMHKINKLLKKNYPSILTGVFVARKSLFIKKIL